MPLNDEHSEIAGALNRIEGRLAEVTKAVNALEEKSDFWHRASVTGGKTRADQVEELLSAVLAGKLVSRALLWTFGLIIAMGAAWSAWKGFHTK